VTEWNYPGNNSGQFSKQLRELYIGGTSSEKYVFIGDADLNRVTAFDLNGNYVRKLTLSPYWGTGALTSLHGRDSYIYITGDYKKIVKTDIHFQNPYTLEMHCNTPSDLAIDHTTGWLFTIEGCGSIGNIIKYDTEGIFIEKILDIPQGTSFSRINLSDGKLYLSESWGHNCSNVKVYDFSGNFIRNIGTCGQAEDEIYRPYDVAIDSSGNVWVTDDTCRIKKFSSTGSHINTFGECGGGNYGAGTSYYHTIYIDSSVKLYAVPHQKQRINIYQP